MNTPSVSMINILRFSELTEGQCYAIWKEYTLVTNRYDQYQTYNNISRNNNQSTGKQEKN